MPNRRPPSIADLFVGGDKLRNLFEVVGMVVTNFGGIEETLRYLDWQLQAYALAAAMPAGTAENDVQIALAEAVVDATTGGAIVREVDVAVIVAEDSSAELVATEASSPLVSGPRNPCCI
jgi:hypothetical protein